MASLRFSVVVAVAAGAAASAGAGCAPEFDPATLITAPRVIAVVAEPPEAVPGQEVTLTPIVAAPGGTLVEGEGYRAAWWRCPDTDSDGLGDFAQCSVASERQDLGGGAAYTDAVPVDLFGAPPAAGEEFEPGDKILGALLGYWRVVGLRMTPDDGDAIDAFKRVPVYLPVALGTVDPRLADLDTRVDASGALVANTNPSLTGVSVHEGSRTGATVATLKRGQKYFFEPRIDDRSLQPYASLRADLSGIDVTDPESLKALNPDELLTRFRKEARCEIPTFNWYVTAGKVRNEVTLDESVANRVYDPQGIACPPVEGEVRAPEAEFTAPDGTEENPLPDDGVVHGWVVLRDGRGGTAVRSFDLAIE